MKIEEGIFDINCKNKINVRNVCDNEIFDLILPENISFIDILFYSSYRKIFSSDTRNYELYNSYDINYDLIEEKMTDLLLKNKKLLNDNIIYYFIYKNENGILKNKKLLNDNIIKFIYNENGILKNEIKDTKNIIDITDIINIFKKNI